MSVRAILWTAAIAYVVAVLVKKGTIPSVF
jgi:hypothetical protein